jgi:hypothetical protein
MHESDPVVESTRLSRLPVESFEAPDTTPPRIAPLAPVREGLPPGFRMRADAHYVDQLDSRMSSIPVRLIDAQSIEAGHPTSEAMAPAFVESVKRFGILQPLLVVAQDSRYRLIAGRRRLAAALAAGFREVPCLVQHVDAEHAEQMALASNVPAARPRPAAPAVNSVPDSPGVTTELTNIVSSLVSCAELLASPSVLTQSVAADLVRAEAARALDALITIRVLRDDMPVSRAPIAVQTLLERLSAAAAVERQIRGIALHVDAPFDVRARAIKADVRLFVIALGGLVAASAALVESSSVTTRTTMEARVMTTIRVGCSGDGDRLMFSVEQNLVELPGAWLARPFDIAWPIRNGASALGQLQAARKIAQIHGGSLEVDAADGGTRFSMIVPTTGAN